MERLSDVSTECLEHEITVLATQIAAATCRWLMLVAEFDRREAWVGWGCRSGAHWLAWQCGLELCTAREHVRVARALEELPLIAAAFGAGRVTYSKVRALSRVATRVAEAELLLLAEAATASQLQRALRAYHSAAADDLDAVNARHAARFVSWSWDDDGSLVLTARLSPEDGAAVVEAIEGTADRLRSHEWNDASADASLRRSAGQRRADALVELAGGSGASTEVVVHVGEDRGELDDGPALHPDTTCRLACDAAVVTMVHDADGNVLDVGRRTRTIPPALRRALRERDGGCRFPGCNASRFVDGHHIRHWSDGGPTSMDNLVTLCRTHHRLVHEGRFQVDLDHRDVRFRRPDGRYLDVARPSAQQARTWRIRAERHSHGTNEPIDLELTVDALLGVLQPASRAS